MSTLTDSFCSDNRIEFILHLDLVIAHNKITSFENRIQIMMGQSRYVMASIMMIASVNCFTTLQNPKWKVQTEYLLNNHIHSFSKHPVSLISKKNENININTKVYMSETNDEKSGSREENILTEAAKTKGRVDSETRKKLLAESIAPWRGLRLFLYAALASGAALGGFITLSGVIAGLSGVRTDLDLNTEVNIMWDYSAVLAFQTDQTFLFDVNHVMFY